MSSSPETQKALGLTNDEIVDLHKKFDGLPEEIRRAILLGAGGVMGEVSSLETFIAGRKEFYRLVGSA